MQTFTAIDFETANCMRHSICSVGLVRVENGAITEKFEQLIRPNTPFDPRNVAIHHIHPHQVANAPTFAQFYETLLPYLNDVVIAHNAAFDISCMRGAIAHYGLNPPDFDYICTLSMSRKLITDIPHHTLDSLAAYYNLGQFNHHNALSDAVVCAKLFGIMSRCLNPDLFRRNFLSAKKRHGGRIEVSPQALKMARENTNPFAARRAWETRCERIFSRTLFAQPDCTDVFDTRRIEKAPSPQRDLIFDYSPVDYTKRFAFTGKFASISRGEAEGLVLYRGGLVDRAVTPLTNYVVVASQRSPSWKYGEYGEKIDLALTYGKAAFITEEHFLKMIKKPIRKF